MLLTNLHIGEEWGYMYLPLIRQYIFDGSKVNNLNAARLITFPALNLSPIWDDVKYRQEAKRPR